MRAVCRLTRLIRLSQAVLLSTALAAPARAAEVDLHLVLAVDVSRSMSLAELDLQRTGYAAALPSPEVIAAITGGPIGAVAIAYVEWAGSDSQRLIADWTVIASAEDATRLASTIAAAPVTALRRTSISGALRAAQALLAASPHDSWRRVIDISGDGPNNQGGPVTAARDAILAQGITINGLPLMTEDQGMGRWSIPDLDAYYAACVIGGTGAFVLPVRAWPEFADAVRRKLVLEISGLAHDGLTTAQMTPQADYDCEIGEKIWQRNQIYWSEP